MARILIAEDSAVMRRLLGLLLQKGGHEIVGEARNGDQAVTLYEQERPDVITMDIDMPELSGLEAARKILASYPDAGIIIISTTDKIEMVLAAYSWGIKHYILKPFTEQKVLEAVQAVLEQA